jgi:parallel beta-helix repeat protein
MNKILLFISVLLMVNLTNLSAQTIIPAGDVSGTWTNAGSAYMIQGDITIPADSTLIIEPNVEVIFYGQYKLTVNGYLEAIGAETDSIYFVPADTAIPWRGLAFNGSNNELSYCNIKYVNTTGGGSGWGAIDCIASNSIISHCTVSDNVCHAGVGITVRSSSSITVSNCSIIRNHAGFWGGGIYVWGPSSLTISNSLIASNVVDYSDDGGGGIYINNGGNLIVTNCTFSNNTSSSPTVYNPSGGGIAALGGNVSVSGSIFTNNTAEWDGGGIWLSNSQGSITDCYFSENTVMSNRGHTIYLENSSPLISHCIFSDNGRIGGVGGGIYVGDNSNPTIDHCDFFQNLSGTQQGGGIHISSLGSMTLCNSIFQENLWYNIYFAGGSSSSISYNDFLLSIANFGGTVPSGLGTLTQVNTNGDSCDVYNNIYLDPLFAAPILGDFHLQSQSPCIDAGDPSSPLDPDSTIADMGCYFFNQGTPVITVSDSLLDFGVVIIAQQSNLPLTIRNIGLNTLILYSIINHQAVFTHNWNPADSLIPPGDSLALTVFFTPTDTTAYCDTLWVGNNDSLCSIQLLGRGVTSLGIGEDNSSDIPKKYVLRQAYPNPFNPITTIGFDLPKESNVVLKIHNILGQEVATLVSERLPAGRYQRQWQPIGVSSGIYFYTLHAGNHVRTKKLLLLR